MRNHQYSAVLCAFLLISAVAACGGEASEDGVEHVEGNDGGHGGHGGDNSGGSGGDNNGGHGGENNGGHGGDNNGGSGGDNNGGHGGENNGGQGGGNIGGNGGDNTGGHGGGNTGGHGGDNTGGTGGAGGDVCVPFTCEVLLRDFPLWGDAECREYDDGCRSRIACGCTEGTVCSDSMCECDETLSRNEICDTAMTCGTVTAQGTCGPVTVSCTDPAKESNSTFCARSGCGDFEVTGQWCSWTEHCGCPDGTACDDATNTCFGLTDSRDGVTYPIVRIGQQVWMASNLRYDAPESECLMAVPNETDCWRWGRYYRWHTAMAGAGASNANPSGVQGVCPAGWHLPSDAEVVELISYISNLIGGAEVGPHLKHSGRSGPAIWSSGLNYDTYGFDLFPAGLKHGAGFYPTGLNTEANLWTSTQNAAPRRYSVGTNIDIYAIDNDLGFLASVRCVRD